MDATTFFSLSDAQVAGLVRAQGPKVCVFPINGTRRWFLLEYPPQPDDDDPLAAYVDAVEVGHIDVYRLMFDHGIDTLLTPCFGPDLLERGDDYIEMAVEGLARLATHPRFLTFYEEYGVRVRFYGDYRKYFGGTPYAYVCDLFDQLTEQTQANDRARLFFGLFANDAAETVAELAIDYYREHGSAPDKDTIVHLYYGEDVAPVDFFIGFDRFSAFDMPLIATGNEDLYFTVAPSLYLSAESLRRILYDHLYTRRDAEPDYAALQPADWAVMKAFYHANRNAILGIGAKQDHGGYWYPLPEVKLPDFSSESNG
jgi:tuberculosinol/isotuberculosinol synthase